MEQEFKTTHVYAAAFCSLSVAHSLNIILLSTICCCLQSTEQPLECGHLVTVTGAGPGLLQWPRP